MPIPTPYCAASSEPAPLLMTPYAFAREAFGLWAMAYGAWFDAAASLSCASFDLCRMATTAHLPAAGVDQPLLNDA